MVQIQGIDVGEGITLLEAGGVVDARPGTGADDHVPAPQRSGFTTIECDFNRLRCDEDAVSQDQLGSTGLVFVEMVCDQVVDHFSFSVADGRHLDWTDERTEAEFSPTSTIRRDLGRMYEVLTGQTSDIRA